MTDQLTLPLFPKRAYALHSYQNGTYSHNYDLTPQEARERVQEALTEGRLTVADLLPFVGALTLGQPGQVQVDDYYERLPCECCSEPVKDFVFAT